MNVRQIYEKYLIPPNLQKQVWDYFFFFVKNFEIRARTTDTPT